MSETMSAYVPSAFTSADASATTANATGTTSSDLADEEFRKRAIARMDADMRARYGEGRTYNFKLILRGDTATGKSTLMRRLRGGTFLREHETTREIKTAHVAWRAKSCPEDNVALEVWDVVDRAPKRNVSENLTLAKRANAAEVGTTHTFPLDATVVDVYRGAHACCVLVDPSKRWTFEYAMRELERVPKHIPSAMVLNFRDYPDEKRCVTSDEAEAAVEEAFGNRPFTPVVIETSLLNCYGLSSVSTFLHVPFLCLKRMSIEQALALNTTATVQAQEALAKVKDASYEAYARRLGVHQPTPEEEALEAKEREANGASTTTSEESSFSWSKLNNMKVGEIPLVVAGAALSTTASAVTTIARKTPAEISQDLANNLKNFATLGGAKTSSTTTETSEAANEPPLPPQFSHLGPGGVERAAFGGRDIADEDKAAIEAMVQKKGGDDGHWLDDDGENEDDEYDAKSDEDEDDGRHVSVKMDGWDDDESASDDGGDVDAESPAHFIRQISKDDPFFGEKPKKNGTRDKKSTAMSPPTSPPAADLDPERLAAAFDDDATPNKSEYEKVEDPLGLTLARSATMSSSEMLSGSEKKKKEKKVKKEKKEKKSAKKSKKKDWLKEWDESD